MIVSRRSRTAALVAAPAVVALLASGCARKPGRPPAPPPQPPMGAALGEPAETGAPAATEEAAGAVKLTAAGFDEAISQGVALVDFWATWCPPCRKQGPVVEKLASAYAGRALVGKVDVDAEGDLAARFGIKSIPTLILFKDGGEAQRLVGLRSEGELRRTLDKALRQE